MLHTAVRFTILRGVIGHHLGYIGEGIGLLPIFFLSTNFLPKLIIMYNSISEMILLSHSESFIAISAKTFLLISQHHTEKVPGTTFYFIFGFTKLNR